MLNGRSLPTTGSVMTKRVESGLTVVGAHSAASHSPERRHRRNHLCGKIIAGDTAAGRPIREECSSLPVKHRR
jgi:hypothetical protein